MVGRERGVGGSLVRRRVSFAMLFVVIFLRFLVFTDSFAQMSVGTGATSF